MAWILDVRGVANWELLQESVPFGMESERVATRDRVCGRDAACEGCGLRDHCWVWCQLKAISCLTVLRRAIVAEQMLLVLAELEENGICHKILHWYSPFTLQFRWEYKVSTMCLRWLYNNIVENLCRMHYPVPSLILLTRDGGVSIHDWGRG